MMFKHQLKAWKYFQAFCFIESVEKSTGKNP
jgi:hypothetical protein